MKVSPLAIADVLLIEPKVFGDERGFFYESFNQQRFNEAAKKNDIEQVFGAMGQGHRALVELMTQALGEMQFYDVMSQRVGHVQGAIHDLSAHLQQLASALDSPVGALPDGQRLQDLLAAQAERYVMHSQIDTHHQVVGGAAARPAAAAPSIELF